MDMPSKKQGHNSTGEKEREFVAVAVLEDKDRAETYKQILDENDIPARIVLESDTEEDEAGFVVMVPDECLDEAHVIIESQDAYDDYYDMAIDDEDMDDDMDDDDEEEDEDEFLDDDL